MLEGTRRLPLSSFEDFVSDPRNTAAAESYLRRALEALLDLGRHVLAKGFGVIVTEYRDIGWQLKDVKVLDEKKSSLCRHMAGYRNRMVHFYHELSVKSSTKSVLHALMRWKWWQEPSCPGFQQTRTE